MAFSKDLPQQRHPSVRIQIEQELQIAKFLLNHARDATFWLEPNAQFFLR